MMQCIRREHILGELSEVVVRVLTHMMQISSMLCFDLILKK